MLALDTDHLTAFGYSSALSRRLKERLAHSGQDVVTTAVNCEEQMKGLLAAIHRERDAAKQITGYSEFVSRLEFLAGFTILPWDSDSAKRFAQHHRLRVRCGTMDLKIACIAMARRDIADTQHGGLRPCPRIEIRELAGLRDKDFSTGRTAFQQPSRVLSSLKRCPLCASSTENQHDNQSVPCPSGEGLQKNGMRNISSSHEKDPSTSVRCAAICLLGITGFRTSAT